MDKIFLMRQRRAHRLTGIFSALYFTIPISLSLVGCPMPPLNGGTSPEGTAGGLYSPAPVGVLTHRYDTSRTGANTQEHVLTVNGVKSADFQLLYKISVAGQVYAQPLLVPNVKQTDGTYQNVLVVATMSNSITAFRVDDAVYGPPFAPVSLWNTVLGLPVSANFMPMGYSSQTCFIICVPNSGPPSPVEPLPPIGVEGPGLYNINPSIGVVSTPVVDPATNTLYVVSKLISSMGAIESHLFSLDLVSGAIKNNVLITATFPGTSSDSVNGTITFDQKHQMQRPALLLVNGTIYLAFGSHQDTLPWHGWVLAYDAATLAQTGVWCSTPNGMGGAIWQAGSGLASADDGNIYFMTGNGMKDPPGGPDNSFNTSSANFANMFVKLSPTGTTLGSFAPGDEKNREGEDTDLGSAGPVHIPNTTVLLGGDKESKIFVLDTTNLGALQIFQAGAPLDGFSAGGSGWHHIHGTPPIWRDSKNILNLYVWPERDYLRVFTWNDAGRTFNCLNSSAAVETCQSGDNPIQQSTFQAPGSCPLCFGSMPGGILSVSSDGTTAGSGILWASIPISKNGLNNVVPGVLRAFDAEDVTQELWSSQLNPGRDGGFMFAKFNMPVVANGRVYMANFGTIPSAGIQTSSGGINVYGMRQWAKYLWDGGYPQTVNAGAPFASSAIFLNAGTTTWQKGAYRLGSQAPQDNSTWGANRVELVADAAPGAEVTFSLNLTAPANPSTTPGCAMQPNGEALCTYQWRMVQENVEWFGEFTPKISIRVVPPSLRSMLVSATLASLNPRTAHIVVTDSQTHQPVAGAAITISGPTTGLTQATTPPPITGSQGTVNIPYARCYEIDMNTVGHPVKMYAPCGAVASKMGFQSASFSVP